MKKIFIMVVVLLTFFLVACGKSSNDIVTKVGKKLDETTSYYAEANMTVKVNNVNRNYQVKVSYKDKDKYKVELSNVETSNLQIIIKNNDGVFVLTPSLNKSFKFNSNWPFNGSHSYLFDSLVKDIVNDDSPEINITGDSIIITVQMNDSIQTHLSKQIITLDKETLKPKEVVLYDTNNQEVTKITFTKFEFNPSIDDSVFEIKKSIDDERDKGVTAPVDREITYPSYVPVDAVLTEKDVMATRAIMKFSGSNGFTVIQEFVDDSTSVSTKNVMGEIVILRDGFGAIHNSSITWVSNGIEYTVFSETLTNSELIKIANSFIMNDEK